MHLGDRLKVLRGNRSQSEIAKALGISRQAVSQWESGIVENLRPENLLAVADYFGVSIRWLVTGRDSRGPPLAEAAACDTQKSSPALSQIPLASTAKRGALPPLAEPDLDPNVLALARAIESLPTDKKGHLSAVVDAFTKSSEVWDGKLERRKGGQKK